MWSCEGGHSSKPLQWNGFGANHFGHWRGHGPRYRCLSQECSNYRRKHVHRVCDWQNRRSLQALVRRNKKKNLYTFSNRPKISHYLFQITGFQRATPTCMRWFLKTLCPYITPCQIAKTYHQVRNLHEHLDIPTPLLRDLVKEGTVVNPVNKTSSELTTLNTGEVMDPVIIDCLKNVPTIGKTCSQSLWLTDPKKPPSPCPT